MPAPNVCVDVPHIVPGWARLANSSTVLTGVKRRFATYAAPDTIIDCVVAKRGAQFGDERRNFRHWMADLASASIHGSRLR
jgi:hypothetical protein